MGRNMASWEILFGVLMSLVKPRDGWTIMWEQQYMPLGHPWKQYKQQHGFGRFHCSRCSNQWASAHVLILFHMKLEKKRRRGRSKGSVKMRIFMQQCKRCHAGLYEEPEFTSENINIILCNLRTSIRQQCYGEYVDEELQSVLVEGRLEGPHDSERCEACHLGICDWSSHSRRTRGQTTKSYPTHYAAKTYPTHYAAKTYPTHYAAKTYPTHYAAKTYPAKQAEEAIHVSITVPEDSPVQIEKTSHRPCCPFSFECFCFAFMFVVFVILFSFR